MASTVLSGNDHPTETPPPNRFPDQLDAHPTPDALAEHGNDRIGDAGNQPGHDLVGVRPGEHGLPDSEPDTRRRVERRLSTDAQRTAGSPISWTTTESRTQSP
jgi:hypothetical protein